MMSWRPDDSKSILKYKEKDNCQESHVARDRDRHEREAQARQRWEHKNTLMHTSCRPPGNSLSLLCRYTQKPQALVPTWSLVTLNPWLSLGFLPILALD